MSERILVIDDDVDTLRLVGLMLQRQGYQVSAASNGSLGLTKAFEERPDLIVLDVMMPDMDGLATFSKLQANPATSSIPVILLTAKVQSIDRQNYTELGIRSTIAKPFSPLELAQQIATTLGWKL